MLKNFKIGTMAKALNGFFATLEDQAGVAANVARGVLSADIAPRSSQDALATALQQMTATLRDNAADTALRDWTRNGQSKVYDASRGTLDEDELEARLITLAYAVLDLETHKLHYTVAGHPPPVLLRTGRPPEQLEGSGFPVGIVDEPEYENYSVQMEPGDRLFFYSDGVTEATNRAGFMLGDEAFVQLVEASRSHSLAEHLTKCIDDFRRWTDAIPLADDISVLALELPES